MVKLEVLTKQKAKTYSFNCIFCKSKQLHIEKKGFSGGNACCGALFLGPLGILCGSVGSNKLKATCLNCGKEFDIGSTLKKKWEENKKEAEKPKIKKLKKSKKLSKKISIFK